MKKMEKELKLKNKYTGDIVHTKNYDLIEEVNGQKFIKVFDPVNPNRFFLVNREAFVILNK